MPARATTPCTPRGGGELGATLLPSLRLTSSLIADFTSHLRSAGDTLLLEDVREAALTIAALERVLASFASETLAAVGAADAPGPPRSASLSTLVDALSAPSLEERVWRLLPPGGVGTLLFRACDAVEAVDTALARLVAASRGGAWLTGGSARRAARAALRAAAGSLSTTLRLLVLSINVLAETKDAAARELWSPAETPPGELPRMRRSRSFTLLTGDLRLSAHDEEQTSARCILESVLLPRAAVTWSNLSSEGAVVKRGLDCLYASGALAWATRAVLPEVAQTAVFLAAFGVFALLPAAWAEREAERVIAKADPALITHLWRGTQHNSALQAAAWALYAAPGSEKVERCIAGVPCVVVRAAGAPADDLAIEPPPPPAVWPLAGDWQATAAAVGEPMLASPTGEGSGTRAESSGPAVILWLHGGGFVASNETFDLPALSYQTYRLGATVIYVRYALAPEHRFPVALRQVLSVYKALRARTSRIVVAGESAGGSLAASLCVALAADGLPQPAAVCLLYAPLNLEEQASTSRVAQLSDQLVPTSILRSLAAMYAPAPTTPRSSAPPAAEPEGDAPVPPTPRTVARAAEIELLHPARARDELLKHFAPTHLVVGGLDPLLDDSVDFRTRLRRVGVPGSLTVHRALPHAFFLLQGLLP
jgi:monoterpene epsilon-lactone hydrolase